MPGLPEIKGCFSFSAQVFSPLAFMDEMCFNINFAPYIVVGEQDEKGQI